jgi:hypothetical protein
LSSASGEPVVLRSAAYPPPLFVIHYGRFLAQPHWGRTAVSLQTSSK